MTFVSIVFKTDIDLWVTTREPGNERIQAKKKLVKCRHMVVDGMYYFH